MADMLQFSNKPSSKPRDKATQNKARRRYNSEEVADIIRVSLQQEVNKPENGIDHDELLSIGKEMGVDDQQIDHAINQLENEQINKNREQLLWSHFKIHGAIFLSINLICLFINLMVGAELLWFPWVVFGTALPLAIHYAGLRYAPESLNLAMKTTWYGPTALSIRVDNRDNSFEDDVNVAFTVGDDSGLLESEGLVYIDEDRLIIEHQTSDSILGVFSTSIKDSEIPLCEIAHAKLTQGFWSSQLIIQGRSLRTFRGLPGVNAGRLQLKIKKESRFAAEGLVEQLLASPNKAAD